VPSLYLSGNLLLHSPEASYGDHDDSAQPDVGLDLALAPSGKSNVSHEITRIAPTRPSRKVAAETKENSSALPVSASRASRRATAAVISR
jgi:hypothetical protein